MKSKPPCLVVEKDEQQNFFIRAPERRQQMWCKQKFCENKCNFVSADNATFSPERRWVKTASTLK